MGHLWHSQSRGRGFTLAILLASVFAFTPPGGASAYSFKRLYAFCQQPQCADGTAPQAGLLIGGSGVLYGTAAGGGKYGIGGAVFSLQPNGGSFDYSAIHNFCKITGCPNGSESFADLIADVDGNLYGTTKFGGTGDAGMVFKLTHKQNGWAYQILCRFCSKTKCADGEFPDAGLSYQGQASGAPWDKTSPLFGTNTSGGAYDNGVVFKLTPNGSQWQYAVIHNLITGLFPNAPLVDPAGNLFITDQSGGKNNGGVLYRLDKDTWHETTIHNFCAQTNCADGAGPVGRLALDAQGNIFGVAKSGGTSGNGGTVFEHPASGGYNVVYDFCSQTNCADGARPIGLSFAGSGRFFGATEDGGANQKGVAFALTRKNGVWSESVIHDFCAKANCTDGAIPISELTQDASGNLFGTTESGGDGNGCSDENGCGTVFELKP